MKKTILILAALQMAFMAFPQKKTDISCKIWKPSGFCEIADSVYFADRVFAIRATWKEQKCGEIDNADKLTGVWLAFNNKSKCKLLFKTNFENFRLIKKSDGKTVYPVAIYKSKHYFISDMKSKKWVNTLKGGRLINLIMLFPEAGPGDKLLIDGFIETEIQYIPPGNSCFLQMNV